MDIETAGRFFTCPKLLAAWMVLKESVDEMYSPGSVIMSIPRIEARVLYEKQMDVLIEAQRILDRLGLK